MNLRFVEAFYWVASLKSISRAAEKLYLTQSAMSSRIAKLDVMAGSPCTMNNFAFGNARYQYCETISGGSGAGAKYPFTFQ